MRHSSLFLAALAAAPLLTSARPVVTRAAASANVALVFQFANVLEQLEASFYQQGLAKFQSADFTAAGFVSPTIPTQILTTIQSDEATHDTFIQAALTANGVTPLTCSFDFTSGLTDVATMAATARVVEYVGVAAYSGAANLLDVPEFLDAAASILTVEARHQSLLNVLSGTGTAIPSPFDVGFTPQEVLSIAGGFITGPCDLGLNATTSLAVTNKGAIAPGDLLTVSATGVTGTDNLFCNIIVGGANASVNLPLAQCNVPAGTNGPVALWITSDATPIPNDVVARATVPTVAGPAVFFVDSVPDALSQLVRSTGTASTTTTTPPVGTDNDSAPPPPPPTAPKSIAALAALQTSKKTVFETCAADAECQQGCCGFASGKCAGPDVAQSNGSGGCGKGDATPNCAVATLLGFSDCVAGGVKGDLQAPDVQQAAAFAAQLDNLPFTPSK
ncbi:ferritin-like domain-containing protein [Mycena capillaripes]|nr:ferritin-like domain-containing protein [Mycena capillaripes]